MKPNIVISFVFPGDMGKKELSQFISNAIGPEEKTESRMTEKKYVYGLKGICDLFGVAHSTAQKYKDGILRDACYQSGRKIVVDVEKAMYLFNQQK